MEILNIPIGNTQIIQGDTILQTLKIALNNNNVSDSSIVSFWQLIRIRP